VDLKTLACNSGGCLFKRDRCGHGPILVTTEMGLTYHPGGITQLCNSITTLPSRKDFSSVAINKLHSNQTYN